MAGTAVDVALFPLDTIKTRLQSSQGFFKAGGFRGIYKGLSAAAIGSAPGGVYAHRWVGKDGSSVGLGVLCGWYFVFPTDRWWPLTECVPFYVYFAFLLSLAGP